MVLEMSPFRLTALRHKKWDGNGGEHDSRDGDREQSANVAVAEQLRYRYVLMSAMVDAVHRYLR